MNDIKEIEFFKFTCEICGCDRARVNNTPKEPMDKRKVCFTCRSHGLDILREENKRVMKEAEERFINSIINRLKK